MENFLNKICVVRTYSAGVHIGTLSELDGKQAVLTNANRLWKWCGAFTLSEVANNGVKSGSRLAATVPFILLTEVIEIIPATNEAIETYAKYIEQ